MPKGVYFRTSDTIAKIINNLSGANQAKGENHYKWKGDKVGYFALHGWIERTLGKPQKCEECSDNSARKYEWANISGEYKRDLTDWKRLCVPCHRKLDDSINKGHITKKLNRKATTNR